MKILVCISKTPDTTAKIAFKDNNTKFNEQEVTFIINPYDEWYALVRALELKEQVEATSIDLITVGGPDSEPILRKAFALGGDAGIRINSTSQDDFYIATQIAEVARTGGYDLILTGKETIDFNGSSIGGMLAGFLDIPFISLATHLELNDQEVSLHREVEGGEEICSVHLPAVVSCQKGMAEQRIANVRGIMSARTKPLKVLEPIEADQMTQFLEFELPPVKSGIKWVAPDQMEELVRLLHQEAKVI
ncbi:MAG: electron transfer flavoprotein subunit beta/FixA family protein [Chitinophagaceae bacterium]